MWKRIIISMTSAFDIVELRWYFLFPIGFSVYFAVIASNNLQKSSAIQKISVILSSVIIAIFVYNYLYFNTLKLQQISLITKFIDTYNSSNSRYLNIFDLFPIPKALSGLNKINGIAFRLAPNNRTQMRLDIELPKRNFIDFIFPKKEYKLKFFLTHSGLIQRQCKLENILKYDFKNIDLKIEMWYKVHKPMKTDWEGKPIL